MAGGLALAPRAPNRPGRSSPRPLRSLCAYLAHAVQFALELGGARRGLRARAAPLQQRDRRILLGLPRAERASLAPACLGACAGGASALDNDSRALTRAAGAAVGGAPRSAGAPARRRARPRRPRPRRARPRPRRAPRRPPRAPPPAPRAPPPAPPARGRCLSPGPYPAKALRAAARSACAWTVPATLRLPRATPSSAPRLSCADSARCAR